MQLNKFATFHFPTWPLAALALVTASTAARAAEVGLLSSVTGDVKVMGTPGGKWSKASLMQGLSGGGSVKVEAGGSAIVVLFQGGARYQLAPGSLTTLTADAAHGVSGPAPKALAALQIRQAKLLEGSRVAGGRAASTILRGGTAHIELQGLSATSVLDAHPVFKWSAVPGAASYKVRLWNGDDEIIWQSETKSTAVTYPADAPALKPDVDYLWNVTTTTGDTLYKGEGIFKVLSDAKRAAVQDELTALGGMDDEAVTGVLRAEVYSRHELWDDAIATYQQLSDKFPDAAPLHEALATLLAGQAREDASRRERKAAQSTEIPNS